MSSKYSLVTTGVRKGVICRASESSEDNALTFTPAGRFMRAGVSMRTCMTERTCGFTGI